MTPVAPTPIDVASWTNADKIHTVPALRCDASNVANHAVCNVPGPRFLYLGFAGWVLMPVQLFRRTSSEPVTNPEGVARKTLGFLAARGSTPRRRAPSIGG